MYLKIAFFIVSIFFCQNIFAQPEGKPELGDWKEIEKKANKADAESQIKMGEVCQGFLEKDEFRSFKKAQIWYEKVQTTDSKLQNRLLKNLFALYYSGGYGVEKNTEKTKEIFEKIKNQTLSYTDKANLDFSKFYEYANSTDPAQKLVYARILFENEIDANEAIKIAGSLAKTNPDAAYLHDKWNLYRKRYRSYGDRNVQEVSLFPMMQKYAEAGSTIARLEWITEAEKVKIPAYQLKAEQIDKLLNFEEKNAELDFKRAFHWQKYQNGTAKIRTLRLMAERKKNLSEEQTDFAKTALASLADFDKQIQSLEGLSSFLRKNPSFDNFGLDLEGYRQFFGGNVRNLIAFNQTLQKADIQAFVGTDLARKYQNDLKSKVHKILFAAKNDTLKMVKFRAASQNNDWLKSFAKNYESELSEYINGLGIAQNLPFYGSQIQHSEKNYSLEQAKQTVETLKEKTLLEQQKMAGVIKRKAITDLLGENPYSEDLEKQELMLLQTAWLQPEGKEMYFAYTSDSPNAFSGYVKVGETPYFYQVTRKKYAQEYELHIKHVKSEASDLVFYSKIKTTFSPENQAFTVKILHANLKDYKWIPVEQEFLSVLYAEAENLIGTEIVGNGLKTKLQNPNNWAENVLKAKENADFFTEKNAIRSALRYWIASFNQVFTK